MRVYVSKSGKPSARASAFLKTYYYKSHNYDDFLKLLSNKIVVFVRSQFNLLYFNSWIGFVKL